MRQAVASFESGDKAQLAATLKELQRFEASFDRAEVARAKAAGMQLLRAAGVEDEAVPRLLT